MHLAVLGINHKTAGVEVREQVALSAEGCRALVQALVAGPAVSEAVAVSTCNRTEVYLSGPALPLREAALECLCASTSASRQDLESSVYYLEDAAAVDHLFAVAGSLDSMVLGEAQILHQLKQAYKVAEEAGGTGVTLNKLMRRSFEVGKRVRTETRIGESSLSIASVSVDLARNVFGALDRLTVLVVGAGEMAELVLTHLRGHGLSRILVANRTFARAVELAGRFGGEAVRYEALEDHLAWIDIVITSTAAPEPIIRRADMERVMRRRKNRPVFLIDIAVPRNVDAAVGKVYNVYLYDIDDLQDVVASNLDERRREAAEARRIVTEEVGLFLDWLNTLTVVPTLVSFREWATGVKDRELEKFLGKMPDLSDDERAKVSALAHSLVNKLIHPATARLKELAGQDDGYRYAEALRVLFGLNGAISSDGTAPPAGQSQTEERSEPSAPSGSS
ncbi:MAG: glutamyl-tRNA reductase [Thermoleophilia bacterium]